jgi:hypothetical protein
MNLQLFHLGKGNIDQTRDGRRARDKAIDFQQFCCLCSVCLGVKYFLINIFWCLVQSKIIINGNYFQFDCKSLFNF